MKNKYESSKLSEGSANNAADLGQAALEALNGLAMEDLKYWASEYQNIESDFSKRYIGKNLKEYEIWEDEAKEAFDKVIEMESKVAFDSIYEKDATERLAAVDGYKSIEAYAGNFYNERNQAILRKIRSSSNDDAEIDAKTVGDLHELVGTYINSTKDFDLRQKSPEQYQTDRASKHNNVIRRINAINGLAEKYEVRPLTFRNFKTNDFIYNERLDYSGETNARAEYDRSSVEQYIRTAFAEDFRKAEMGNGDNYYDPNKSVVAQFHFKD